MKFLTETATGKFFWGPEFYQSTGPVDWHVKGPAETLNSFLRSANSHQILGGGEKGDQIISGRVKQHKLTVYTSSNSPSHPTPLKIVDFKQ